MATTDTVVGIVGAVLLVAVMAGVFVYEYNNAGSVAPGPSVASFQGKFPALNATGDLDGDGKANWEDSDMDGDGLADDEDSAVSVTAHYSGSAAGQPPAPGSSETKFKVERGAQKVLVLAGWTCTVPNCALEVPSGSVALIRPDGDVVQGTKATSGSRVTVTIETDEDLVAGEWTIRITQGQASPALTFDGEHTVDYGVISTNLPVTPKAPQ